MSSPLHSTLISTDLTTRQLFRFYSDQRWAMLLDSGTSKHIDAQFDIIVHSPVVTLISDDNDTIITQIESDQQIRSNQNPFKLLEQELNKLSLDKASFDRVSSSNSASNFPFSGGAMGLFSYDLGRHCEQINNNAIKDIDVPAMAIGIYKHAIVFNHKNKQFHVVSRSTKQAHQQYINDLLNTLETYPTPSNFVGGQQWQHQINKTQYQEKFNKVQAHLRQGDCYQVNLTQRFELPYQGNEYNAYLALANNNETPFSGFIRLDNCVVMSLSPERFLQTHQQHIQTKPIKGTIARSKDKIKDRQLAQQLRDSEKDQSENLMIVDLLRNDIGRNAIAGSVDVPALFEIESFENVHHLVSTITAQLPDDVTPIQLLRDAFPGGSITGAPKISAMNIIDNLEPSRRSVYCGSIGYISADGNMDTSITIRTLLATNHNIYAWAGGGIVADSTVESEYQECLDKLSSIMPLLVNANFE